jgi:hypothetical protein
MTQCISRTTFEDKRILFPDGFHYYYPEFQCTNAIFDTTSKRCKDCFIKLDYIKVQGSRKFDHGNIGEPIPAKSHIIGGEWYENHVKKYVSKEMKEMKAKAKMEKKRQKESQKESQKEITLNKPSQLTLDESPTIQHQSSTGTSMTDSESFALSTGSSTSKKIIKKIIKKQAPTTKRLINLTLDIEFTAYESIEDPQPIHGYETSKLTRKGDMYVDSDGVEFPVSEFGGL